VRFAKRPHVKKSIAPIGISRISANFFFDLPSFNLLVRPNSARMYRNVLFGFPFRQTFAKGDSFDRAHKGAAFERV
jgi:hypothetical protein